MKYYKFKYLTLKKKRITTVIEARDETEARNKLLVFAAVRNESIVSPLITEEIDEVEWKTNKFGKKEIWKNGKVIGSQG